jgi:hypothetical protein
MRRIISRAGLGLLMACLAPAQDRAGVQDTGGALVKPPPLHLTHGDASLDVIPERRAIRFSSSNPESPLERRIEELRSLLSAFFRNHPKEPRYSFTFGQYPELNARMASAASCSPQWDAAAGRSRSGTTAAWLRETLGRAQAFRELTPVFETFGYRIDIAAMESIALCRPTEIDWARAPRSCQSPLPSTAKVPCGALLTFALTAK